MFYIKHRPRRIEDLDNSQIKEKITNLLESKNIPHALLFVGPKGTGKTSTARIVAKSLNCLENSFSGKGSSFEPCGKCINCKNIESDSSPDVVEMDAASNRGIDEVRKLIKEASFSPMTSKYRIYIIDEAHMITKDAFNALLKTIEEPPETVIFIMATTNEEKIPDTIISRCLRLSFGRAKKQDVKDMINRISKKEKIDVNEELLEIISEHSDYSFRDAAKMLEELFVQNALDAKTAEKYLGIRAKGSLLTFMSKNDLKNTLSWLEEYTENGGNSKLLIESSLEILRKNLLAKSMGDTSEDDLDFSLKEISKLIGLFHEAYNMTKSSPIEELPLEIVVVEFYNFRSK